jgi:sugar phosphate isomerase/epimerase
VTADAGPFALTCSANTLRHADMSERLRAVSAAGFTGLGLRLADHRASGLSTRELRAGLDAHGLRLLEMEHLWDWADPTHDQAEDEIWALADTVGFRQLNVSMFAEHETAALVARFGALCDRAAEHGVLVALEFMPFTTIRTLPEAWHIVCAADRANAGVLIDLWHWRRTSATLDDLAAVPTDRITSLQLCEARTEALPDMREEARHHRELPGRGQGADGGTAALLAGMAAQGLTCPVAVEMFSDELDALPAARTAAITAAACAEVLAAAGWAPGTWATNLDTTEADFLTAVGHMRDDDTRAGRR